MTDLSIFLGSAFHFLHTSLPCSVNKSFLMYLLKKTWIMEIGINKSHFFHSLAGFATYFRQVQLMYIFPLHDTFFGWWIMSRTCLTISKWMWLIIQRNLFFLLFMTYFLTNVTHIKVYSGASCSLENEQAKIVWLLKMFDLNTFGFIIHFIKLSPSSSLNGSHLLISWLILDILVR